jgi:glycosyltransferase involved in cell wall biosynthesis
MTPGIVSVIIPTYNYGHFVTEAVDSALAQGYQHREIIVVDDGSTDNTRQILDPYRDRIQYIYQPNQGLSAARNTGIRAAHGEYIALLDSDDVWHPRKLELQVSYLREHPEIGLLATNQVSDRRDCWPAVDDDVCSRVPILYALDEVVGRAHFGPSSVLIRRSCLDAVGLFDPSLRCVEDRDMWIRLGSRFGLAKLPVVLLWYRLHAASLSNKAAAMEQHELRVLEIAFAEIPALRGRWLLQRKVRSQAAFASAQVFREGGKTAAAIRRVLSSLFLWPLPLGLQEDNMVFVRMRVLLNLGLRLLGLRRRPEVNVEEPLAGTPQAAVRNHESGVAVLPR